MLLLMSRYTRESGHSSTSWFAKGWSPSKNKHQTTKSSDSGWSKRCTRGNPSEYEGRHSYWDVGKARDSANDTEGVAVERKEKTHGRAKGTEEDGMAVLDTKENTPNQDNAKYFVATEQKLWELQRLLNDRNGSLSSTCKKNTEANTRVYDLNQKTMQALDALPSAGRAGGHVRAWSPPPRSTPTAGRI